MRYTTEEILKMLEAELLNEVASPLFTAYLLLDSRRVLFPETSLFFALPGTKQDGHQFIEDAYKKGVRQFVLSRKVDISSFQGANFFLVPDVTAALQALARHFRHQFDIPVIGITGSNGKTIVKEWLFQLLHEDYHIVRSPRSYNSQVGVPLSIAQLEAHHNLAVFEAGISRPGEMEKLAPMIDCHLGIFTNIGTAHQEAFSSLKQKATEKARLFEKAEAVIYCRDYPEVHDSLSRLEGVRLISWSRKTEADLFIREVREENGMSHIAADYKDEQISIRIPFTDKASIENAIHCWCVMLFLAIHPVKITNRMRNLRGVEMRLEQKTGINGCTLINDSYNADLTSLNIAIDFLQRQSNQKEKILILSDMLQSGMSKEDLYQRVAQLLIKKRISRLIGIGRDIPATAHYLPDEFPALFFPDSHSFLRAFSPLDFRDAAILVKGARAFQLESIASRLTLQSHNTVLEINLDALAQNLSVFKGQLAAGTRIMAMVKAAGYGSGIIELGRLLEFHRIDYLGVAYADEGIRLREAGIQTPILVLNPEEDAFDRFIRYRLEPEIYSLRLLHRWNRQAKRRSTPFSVHLMFDTGMHRLGFAEADLQELCDFLKASPLCRVKAIFTHLASSGNPKDDDFTHLQLKRFSEVYELVTGVLGYRPLRHVLNSSGILRFPEYQLEMVRLGLGLYGQDLTNSLQLETVLQLKARISQIRMLDTGETVGYNRRGQLLRKSRIATVTVGYADGLPRLAGNGRYALKVGGKKAPTVGDICMDMCMIDVTDVPEAREGSEVIVFGEGAEVEELARVAQTIPYEIFTNISERVKRVYFQE
jgi:alanine racemase